MTSKRFLSRAEVAEALGVSEQTVDRMVADGRIAATQTAGRRSRALIPASELDRLEAEAMSNLREAEANRRGADRLARLLTPEAVPIRFPADGGPAYLGGFDNGEDGEDEF